MKRVLQTGLLCLLVLALGACASGADAQERKGSGAPPDNRPSDAEIQKAKVEPPTKVGLVRTGRSINSQYGSGRQYYVAIGVEPLFTMNPGEDKCFDESFFSFLRRIFKEDNGSILLTANVKTPWALPARADVDLPLFMMQKLEKPPQGTKSACLTKTVGVEGAPKAITPFIVASSNTKFEVRFEMYARKEAQSDIAAKAIDAISSGFSLLGGSGWVIGKLTSVPFQKAADEADAYLEKWWKKEQGDDQHTDFRHQPLDGASWDTFNDQFIVKAPGIRPGPGGMTMTGLRDAVSLTLLTKPSFYTTAQSIDEIMQKSLDEMAGANQTLAKIVTAKWFGEYVDGLPRLTDRSLVRDACVALRNGLITFLTTEDALIARLAVLKDKGIDDLPGTARASQCLDAGDEQRLNNLAASNPTMRYLRISAPPEPTAATNRDDQVKAIMDPIRAALATGRKDRLSSQMVEPEGFRLAVRPSSKALDLPGDMKDLTGDDAINWLVAQKARICSYQASPGNGLSLLAAHINVGGKNLAVAFNFAGGGLDAMRIEKPKEIAKWIGFTADADVDAFEKRNTCPAG